MRVAVIDDSTGLASMLRLMLEHEGSEVVTVTADFERLLSDPPWIGVDVALVDLMLPEVGGDRIIAYLAAHQPHIRRIVLSAIGHRRPELATLATMLAKPVAPALLLSAIRGDHD